MVACSLTWTSYKEPIRFLINFRPFHDGYVTLFLGFWPLDKKVRYSLNVIYTFCTHFAPYSMIIYPLHNFCCTPLLPAAGLQQVG